MTDYPGSLKTPISAPSVPAVSVAHLTDPTAVRDGMEVLDQDVISLDGRPFLAQRIMVQFETGLILFQHTSHKVRSHTKVDPNRIAFVATGPRAKGTINGISIRPNTIIVAAPETEAELVVEAGYSSVCLIIRPENLLDHLSILGHRAEFRMPSGVELVRSAGTPIRNYFNLGRRIARTAKRQPGLFNDNETVRVTAFLEILETLLAVLSQKSDFQLSDLDRKRHRFSQLIKVVTTYAERNEEDLLCVSDLCRAGDVSERTLQYAFQEVVGTTPMAYLKLLRLHRVRNELRGASRGQTTVSALALNWGFWHFGDFSRAYKKCFHELPSETLRIDPLTN